MRAWIEISLSAQFYCSVSCSGQTLTIMCYLQLKNPFLKIFFLIRKPLQFLIVTEQMLGLAVSEFEWIKEEVKKNPGWFSSSLTVTSLVVSWVISGFNEKGRLGFWTWEILNCGGRCADREEEMCYASSETHRVTQNIKNSTRKLQKYWILSLISSWQERLGLFLVCGASRTSFQAAHQHAFPEGGNWFHKSNPDSFSDLQLPAKCPVSNDCSTSICKLQKSSRDRN